MIRKIVAVIFWIFYLPCIPVRVPQRSIGFLPVGPAIVKESVQTPKVVSTMSKLVKSSLNWHISVIKTKISEYSWHYLVFFWHSLRDNPGFVRDQDILWTQKCKLGTKIDQKISLICFTIFFFQFASWKMNHKKYICSIKFVDLEFEIDETIWWIPHLIKG